MTKDGAQKTLNILLSDRVTFKGNEFPVLLDVVRELQVDIDGHQSDPEGGDTETPSPESG